MAAFSLNNWEIWIALASLLGVLTAWLYARYRDSRIRKQLGQWAQEDQARVDEINENQEGRDG